MLDKIGIVGIKILVALYYKEMYIRELIRTLNVSSASVYRVLPNLLELGLVVFERRDTRKYVRLTVKGRRVAEFLSKAEKITIQVESRMLNDLLKSSQ